MTTLLGVDGAGVMLEDTQGTLRFIVVSDDQISRIEQLQVDTGEGPCLQAHVSGEQVLIADRRSTQTLPLRPRALESGIRAAYSFPMRVDEVPVGAMNLYRRQPSDLDDDTVTAAQLLADLATTDILSVDAANRTGRLASQLQQALDSRVVIEQAKGKLSAAWDVDVSTAFECMRRHARSNHRRLQADRIGASPQ